MIISLDPTVEAYLVGLNIACHNTTEYFSDSAHENGLRKSTDLLNWLSDRFFVKDS